jgi:hypothetical protein
MTTVKEVEQHMEAHEELCAERYATIHRRLDRIEAMLNKLIWTVMAALVAIIVSLVSTSAMADTTINYKGQPVPSSFAPSMSAFSQDVCAVPASGGINTGVISLSGGTVLTDENCVRIKLAKTLNDLGLKVSAVSVLCEDIKVWNAMEMSGSPCPIGSALGDTARIAWYELYPERFEALYGKDFKMPTYTKPINLE